MNTPTPRQATSTKNLMNTCSGKWNMDSNAKVQKKKKSIHKEKT
jgi:hypothetical protein